MVKVEKQRGTVTEITNTGSVTVQINDTLEDVLMLTSDFPTMPRLGQRVTLETCYGYTSVAK